MGTVRTKQGDVEVDGVADAAPARDEPPFDLNRVTGEISFRDHQGMEHKLRPTFEALMEIEDATGVGVEALRSLFAAGGLPGMAAPTTRQIGVVLAAGLKAAGQSRATPEAAAKFAYDVGRRRLRPVLVEFLWCLCDGGRARAEDLGKGESSSASPDGADQVSSLITELESRSEGYSG